MNKVMMNPNDHVENRSDFSDSDLYYLEDFRKVTGNSVQWWALDGNGYTCDIRCAQLWTQEELMARGYWEKHEKYTPWPKETVERLVQHHVDFQDLKSKTNNGEPPLFPHTIKAHMPDLVISGVPRGTISIPMLGTVK